MVCRLFAGGRWIRTFGTAEGAGVLVGLGVSLAPTFPQREIRKRRHEAVFEISIAACGTDVSNLAPSSRQSVSLPQPLWKVENPAFRAGLGSWLGDRVSRDGQAFHCAPTGGNISVAPYSSTAVPLR